MELKLRKRINNGLPGFLLGFTPEFYDNVRASMRPLPVDTSAVEGTLSTRGGLAGVSPWVAMAQFAAGGVAEGINSIKNADQLRANAGTSNDTINGISYQKENEIDQGRAMRDYDRELGTSFLTNPFKGLTMLFGRRKQRRNIRRARMEQDMINTTNRTGAASEYLEQEYANKYGNPQDLLLYKNGKDSVLTSQGELNITPNSKTEGGEIVYNAEKQTAHIIPGKANGDNHLSSILPSDTIITNKYGLADKAKTAAIALLSLNKNRKNRGSLGKLTDDLIKNQATSVLNNIAEEQKQMRNMGMLPQTKMNKFANGIEPLFLTNFNPTMTPPEIVMSADPLPVARWTDQTLPSPTVYTKPEKDRTRRRRDGIPSNWWIDGLGALSATGKLIADSLKKPKRSNTYAENPYSRYALNELSSLRINPYPIMKGVYGQERRNLYAINRAGGLSGAQKYLANIATGIGTQNNIAGALAGIQKQNNEYRSSAMHAALNAGQADRQARMAANQWDLDYYSKSHAAKQQMVEQDWYNALAALQQGYANAFKRHTFNRMMDLYTD